MDIYDIMKSRRSARKFTDEKVSDEQINELISAAVTAPSGCNSQCWRFVAVRTPEKIAELSAAIEKGVRRFYADSEDEAFVASRVKQSVFVCKAPLVIFVYMTDMKYHDPRVEDYYDQHGHDHAEMLRLMHSPDVMSVGAAIENLLLKAEEMGLGACWTIDPVTAESEIAEVLGADKDSRLMSVIPVGKSAYQPREKVMKPMSEVLEII